MCGLFGIYNNKDKNIAEKMLLGLFALQHRGQEAAGVTFSNGKDLFTYKNTGLVMEVLRDEMMNLGRGAIAAIGHVRYSTLGKNTIQNAQPLTITSALGKLSIAHNGNLVNAKAFRKKLEEQGCIFQTTSDTEIILQLTARSMLPPYMKL